MEEPLREPEAEPAALPEAARLPDAFVFWSDVLLPVGFVLVEELAPASVSVDVVLPEVASDALALLAEALP